MKYIDSIEYPSLYKDESLNKNYNQMIYKMKILNQ